MARLRRETTRSIPDVAAELTTERVLCAVEYVPIRRVVSYGDPAELVDISTRRVGAIMTSTGPGVPW